MAKHGPEDNLDNQAPDGGVAMNPAGSAAAQREFEKALRRGHTGDLNRDPERDTGASTTPA